AKQHRCLVFVDGFFEHHHFNGKTYPFYIHKKNNEPMALAGLYSEFYNENGGRMNTFTIVTTQGNSLLTKIHNNPKLEGPRMPLILPEALEDEWLRPIKDELDKQQIQELIQKYPDLELDYRTVRRLRGKEYMGNVETIDEEYEYEELVF
ncbi:MAG: SOS response-associated peptidase family protein, partial [Flavobacteriaceae bacterium]